MMRLLAWEKEVETKGQMEKKVNLHFFLLLAEEFAVNEFHATKVSTIVRKAGVTQPTFYLYFDIS